MSRTGCTWRTALTRAQRPMRCSSRPGEEILVGNSQRFRVLDVVPFEEEDESPFVGLLQVEAA
jgi:hypothetical protein